MTSGDLQHLMLLYVADLADSEERSAVEQWLASGHPAAAAAYAEAQALVAAMASAVTPIAPAPTQWAALEARLTPTAPTADGPTSDPTPMAQAIEAADRALAPRRAAEAASATFLNWRHILTTAAAAAVAGLGVWLWLKPHVDMLESEVAEKKQKIVELAEIARGPQTRLLEQTQALAAARAQLEALRLEGQASTQRIAQLEARLAEMSNQFRMVLAPTVKTADLASTSSLAPDAVARAFVDEDAGRVQVALARFTPTNPGQTYQCWLLIEGQPPTSLGTVEVAPDGTALLDAPLPATRRRKLAIAVSLEDAGGKPLPEGKIIAYGLLEG